MMSAAFETLVAPTPPTKQTLIREVADQAEPQEVERSRVVSGAGV